MSDIDLKKRAEELEQSLQLQLAQLKKDSETWLKVGGAIVGVALVVSAVAKKSNKKKGLKNLHLAEPIEEPVRQIQKKAQKASFFSPFKKRLFMALLSLGQAKLMEELKKRQHKFNES